NSKMEHGLDNIEESERCERKLIDIRAVQHMLAEISKEIAALEALTYKVAWMTDQNKRVVKDAAIAKLYGSEVYNKVADLAVQIHGGIGYMKDYPIERYFRDARITKIYEGTSEIQKNIIAGELKRQLK